MNTKTVRLDDNTRRILRGCSIRQSGAEWHLDLPQLDRKDYVKAKKALTALNCVWSRKAGTHICREDPTEAITGVINGDDIEVPQYDFFPTPIELVTRMIEEADIEPGMICLEPSAGDGRIAIAMVSKSDRRNNVMACEMNVQAQHILKTQDILVVAEPDFMKYNPEGKFDRIVMNPPFSKEQDIQHVLHAWDLLAPGGRIVAIMSEHAFCTNSNRRCVGFQKWLDNVGWSEELPEGTFKESGTMIRTRLVVIDKPAKLEIAVVGDTHAPVKSSVVRGVQQELWAAFQ